MHDLTNEVISTAVAIGNFIRAGRGGQSQPRIELDILQQLEAKLSLQGEQLQEGLGELSDLVEPALDEAKTSGLGSQDLQELVSGDANLDDTNRNRAELVLGALSVDLKIDPTD